MKIVFHPDYCKVYSSDPAPAPGRMEAILQELKDMEIVQPSSATEEDLALVHTQNHINNVKAMRQVYKVALLAVGGAMKASEIALTGEPAFALIRPPGHHASPDGSWGFCYFNNIAISIENLRRRDSIKKAIIVDIDLHYGDGTANIFTSIPEVTYHYVARGPSQTFLSDLASFLESIKEFDIIAVSAGFDRHQRDWGGMLKTQDYQQAAKIIKEFSKRTCGGKRYAVLEGGYNHKVLGKNVKAFIEGFK